MSEEKEYQSFKEGDSVWQVQTWLGGGLRVIEKTVDADTGTGNSHVSFYEGPAHAVTKLNVCKRGDRESAMQIMEKAIDVISIELDYMRMMHREFSRGESDGE